MNETDTHETIRKSTSDVTLLWKWMRFSAFFLIPLVWLHTLIQDLIVGGHNLSLSYVQGRWAFLGWRIYDIFLLAFALTHGLSGLRQVLCDFIKTKNARRILDWSLVIFGLLAIAIGAAAIIGGVRAP